MEATELRIGNLVFGEYEEENECTEASCNNESVNFCECDEYVDKIEVVSICTLDPENIIGCDYQIYVKSGTQEHYSSFEPIPLTEEWLLKFGFGEPCKYGWFNKRYNTTCIEDNEEMTVSWNIKSKRLSIFDSIEETDMVNILSHPIYCAQDLEYVHQLQNLYFAFDW
mgnify:CR=1 FL=1|tara:strand:+ start:833 stop:1336 length:504 start_codon:yes stop_codon:yes gene_type:complete